MECSLFFQLTLILFTEPLIDRNVKKQAPKLEDALVERMLTAADQADRAVMSVEYVKCVK